MEQQVSNSRIFKCYFCNRKIENETEFGHNSSCGAVLEPCPNKCGLYVPRNMKLIHTKECENKKSKSISKLDDYNMYHTTNSIDRVKIKQTMYSPAIPDKLDEIYKKFSQTMFVFKNKQQEIIQAQQNCQTQTKMVVDKLNFQNQLFNEWRKGVDFQLANFKQEPFFQKLQPILLTMETNFKILENKFHFEQDQSLKVFNSFEVKFAEIKDYLAQEDAVVGALWNDQKISLDSLSREIANINKTLSENKAKQCSWVFDIRNVGQIAAETSDKQELQEKVIDSLRNELAQAKADLASLEEAISAKLCASIVKDSGRLLWKITDFQDKMESARANDTILKSPMFYTHEYGYKIRLQVYLNGLKKWKGRHAIMCLTVLKGDYDLLLPWPCLIEGTVIVRDLYNRTHKTDYTKYILAKRYSADEETEEPQESSTQYIFIPHSTLTKQNFIREDTMFIEILINTLNRHPDETEL